MLSETAESQRQQQLKAEMNEEAKPMESKIAEQKEQLLPKTEPKEEGEKEEEEKKAFETGKEQEKLTTKEAIKESRGPEEPLKKEESKEQEPLEEEQPLQPEPSEEGRKGQQPSEKRMTAEFEERGQEQQPQQKQHKLPKNMKAARLVEFGKPVEIQDVPVPEPGPCEVLVQVTVCGVCHGDLHMRNAELESFRSDELPITLGHEGVGKVYLTGPGATRFNVGDRVCVSALADACLHCEQCCDGWETACMQAKMSGFHRDGHFAQFVVAKEDFLSAIPDDVTDEQAAPMTCAGVTSYRALKASRLRAGQWVVIVGAAGGVGYYAIQFAKAMGLKVIAVAKGDEKIQCLKKIKDIYILDSSIVDVTEKVMALTNKKGAHGALILAPCNEAFEEAPGYLRHRGKLVLIGEPTGSAKFDMAALVLKTITMIGSLNGSRCDLAEALQFVADGVVKSEPTVRDFSELNDVFDEMAGLKVTGKDVVRIPDPVHPSEAAAGPSTSPRLSRKERTKRRLKDLLRGNRRIARYSGSVWQLLWPLLAVALALAFTYAELHTHFFSLNYHA